MTFSSEVDEKCREKLKEHVIWAEVVKETKSRRNGTEATSKLEKLKLTKLQERLLGNAKNKEDVSIKEIIDTYEGEEKLGKKKLIDQLLEVKGIKIAFSYLEFLLDIIKNYYNFDLSGLSDYYFPAFGI